MLRPFSARAPEGALLSARAPEGALLSARAPEGALLSARAPEGALRRVRIVGLVASLLVGCDASAGSVDDTRGPQDDALLPEQVVPVTLRCQFFYRESNEPGPGESDDDPKFVHTEKVLSVAAGQQNEVTLGKVTLRAAQNGEKAAGGAFNIFASADGRQLASWLYQFDLADPPRDQFVGGHGFTGLVYLTHPTAGGDYQFMCSAIRDAP